MSMPYYIRSMMMFDNERKNKPKSTVSIIVPTVTPAVEPTDTNSATGRSTPPSSSSDATIRYNTLADTNTDDINDLFQETTNTDTSKDNLPKCTNATTTVSKKHTKRAKKRS